MDLFRRYFPNLLKPAENSWLYVNLDYDFLLWFEEGGQEIQPLGEVDSSEDEFGDDFEDGSPVQSCDDLDGNSNDFSNIVTETKINSQMESARHESSSRARHFYVDVPNLEENNYDLNGQHITIDPKFWEELKR